MRKIKKVSALKILDSRGDWTVETRLELDGGAIGVASVPSGASVGGFEVRSLPAESAAEVVESLNSKLIGRDFENQEAFDQFLLELDGTTDKSKLGGNTLLSLSIAFCKAGAAADGLPLYRYLDQLFYPTVKNYALPIPIFNVINGGKHVDSGLDFQEFLVIPNRGHLAANIEAGQAIYQALHSILLTNNLSTDVGDEGGFALKGVSVYSTLNFLMSAVKLAGYEPGVNVFLGLDCAASVLRVGEVYRFKGEGLDLTAPQLRDYYLKLSADFPLVYLEDPLSEVSLADFRILQQEVSGDLDIVGDDLVASHPQRIGEAAKEGAITAVVIKPNQVGTVWEVLEAVKVCRQNHLAVVASHRSGETTDTFIADFAAGVGAKYLKAGAPARGERVVKYDRLLEIEKEVSEESPAAVPGRKR